MLGGGGHETPLGRGGAAGCPCPLGLDSERAESLCILRPSRLDGHWQRPGRRACTDWPRLFRRRPQPPCAPCEDSDDQQGPWAGQPGRTPGRERPGFYCDTRAAPRAGPTSSPSRRWANRSADRPHEHQGPAGACSRSEPTVLRPSRILRPSRLDGRTPGDGARQTRAHMPRGRTARPATSARKAGPAGARAGICFGSGPGWGEESEVTQ
jgi:hypothetical protein